MLFSGAGPIFGGDGRSTGTFEVLWEVHLEIPYPIPSPIKTKEPAYTGLAQAHVAT